MEQEPGGLESELERFTGTERYWQNFLGLVYTDGIRHLAKRAQCYWLIDLVDSYQASVARRAPFQVWRVEAEPNGAGIVTMKEDDGMPELVHQDLEFTDFPLPEFEFYCIDGVMLLKSEY